MGRRWCWQGGKGFPSPIQPLVVTPGEAMPEDSLVPVLVSRGLYHGWDAESQTGDEVLGTSGSPEGLFWNESYEYSWNIDYRGQLRDRFLLKA